MPPPKPVFIVGTGRSGTTLLASILSAHPEMYVTLESGFLLNTCARRYRKDPTGERERYFASVSFRWLRTPELLVDQRLEPGAPYNEFFRAVLLADAERHGKKFFGDKTPAHWMQLNSLLRCFPNAVVIHLMRDPYSVVASLQRMPWASPSLIANAIYWERCVSKLARDSRVLNIRFEDLVADPELILKGIIQRLGLEWSDHLLDHRRFGVPMTNKVPWLQQATLPINSKNGNNVNEDAHSGNSCPTVRRNPLSPVGRMIVNLICRSSIRIYGKRNSRVSTWQRMRAICSDLPNLLRTISFIIGLWLKPPQPGADELRRWLRHNPDAFRHWPDWDAERVVATSLPSPEHSNSGYDRPVN